MGISSCKDYAPARGRPIAASDPVMSHIKHYTTEAASHAGCDAILVALELRDCSGLGHAGDRLYGTK